MHCDNVVQPNQHTDFLMSHMVTQSIDILIYEVTHMYSYLKLHHAYIFFSVHLRASKAKKINKHAAVSD